MHPILRTNPARGNEGVVAGGADIVVAFVALGAVEASVRRGDGTVFTNIAFRRKRQGPENRIRNRDNTGPVNRGGGAGC